MTHHAPAPADIPVPREAVPSSCDIYWTVTGCQWTGGTLPDDVAALLAPPIVVGAAATPRRAPNGTG
jgi:hypothetical protein